MLNFKKNTSINITDLEPNYDAICGITPDNHKSITLEQLEQHPERYNLLDVRETEERALYNIGGQHIPLGELTTKIDEVFTNKGLVVYCKSGVRSKKAIQILKAKGFNNILLELKDYAF